MLFYFSYDTVLYLIGFGDVDIHLREWEAEAVLGIFLVYFFIYVI